MAPGGVEVQLLLVPVARIQLRLRIERYEAGRPSFVLKQILRHGVGRQAENLGEAVVLEAHQKGLAAVYGSAASRGRRRK